MLKFIVSMSLLGVGALTYQPAFAGEKPDNTSLVAEVKSGTEPSLAWFGELKQQILTLPEFQAQEA